MTAEPIHDPDPDDPVEILRVLPSKFHENFLAEYRVAVTGAQRPEHYKELHDLLRLWRLRAVAYSAPGYEDRRMAAREGRSESFVPAEQVIPGWPFV